MTKPMLKTYYALLPVGYTKSDLNHLEVAVNDSRIKYEYLFQTEVEAERAIIHDLHENPKDYYIVRVFEQTLRKVVMPND